MPSSASNNAIIIGLATAAAASLLFYFFTHHEWESTKSSSTADGHHHGTKRLYANNNNDDQDNDNDNDDDENKTNRSIPYDDYGDKGGATTTKSVPQEPKYLDEKQLHAKIEAMDKKGKALFKDKKFLEAAQAFTEALELIERNSNHADHTAQTSLNRQVITLINNRSAMYEKASVPELALEDCDKILQVYDRTHMKARTRKLRILEDFKQYYDALVEVCALQLLYMQQNRDSLRLGLPASSPPPVPQSKLEELLSVMLPAELEKYEHRMNQQRESPTLPSDYTLLQLLKSYTGYFSWMASAAKDGSLPALRQELEKLTGDDDNTQAARASLLLKIGRRQIYESQFALARKSILKGLELVENNPNAQDLMQGDDFPRLLEWSGMVKHWTYDLEGAMDCYEECTSIEPFNAQILVKQAGVAMDGGKHDEALDLFDRALALDPNAVDALLHRANLRMLQQNLDQAQEDLQKCVRLRPDHVLAHLRLAAVLTSKNNTSGAKKHLEKAEEVDPDSSEVQSYKGELLFTQNDFAAAKEYFEKAMKAEPKNPTPYVNAALAELNTPPQPGQQLAIAQEACRLLEKAIEVDPQFHAAYVQLGQLKLGTATDLSAAKDVIALYDQGLANCRTKDELKDLCSMRLLTMAQVDAASALKMETFNMQ